MGGGGGWGGGGGPPPPPPWALAFAGSTWFVEAFVPGEYKKHNDNAGLVSNKHISGGGLLSNGSSGSVVEPTAQAVATIRNTPQAFSHFTHEYSEGDVMIVDIQGVADLYTDPQVHSRAGFNHASPEYLLRSTLVSVKTAETSGIRVSQKIAKTVSRHAEISDRFRSDPAVLSRSVEERGDQS